MRGQKSRERLHTDESDAALWTSEHGRVSQGSHVQSQRSQPWNSWLGTVCHYKNRVSSLTKKSRPNTEKGG